jgi:FixJ family two-component response regulator
MKKPLISVVEDDPFFRESMGRLMRSLGYSVEAFPGGRFPRIPRLAETACLIADVHMPAMTGSNSTDASSTGHAISDNPRDCLPQ